jgi:hypothetical protein
MQSDCWSAVRGHRLRLALKPNQKGGWGFPTPAAWLFPPGGNAPQPAQADAEPSRPPVGRPVGTCSASRRRLIGANLGSADLGEYLLDVAREHVLCRTLAIEEDFRRHRALGAHPLRVIRGTPVAFGTI